MGTRARLVALDRRCGVGYSRSNTLAKPWQIFAVIATVFLVGEGTAAIIEFNRGLGVAWLITVGLALLALMIVQAVRANRSRD
jgi:hypothetical protein